MEQQKLKIVYYWQAIIILSFVYKKGLNNTKKVLFLSPNNIHFNNINLIFLSIVLLKKENSPEKYK